MMRTTGKLRIVRSSALALLAALVPAATAGEAQASGTFYTYVDIGKIAGSHVTVPFSMNNAGHVVGWGQGPGSQVRPMLWTPATGIQEIPLPAGFDSGYATDISNSGIIVGTAYIGIGANQARAWRWVNGVHQLLPPFPSSCPGMIPTAVNDFGDMVGYTCPDGGGPANAWYFSNATGLVDLLPLGIANANDINNRRVVTGRLSSGPAFRWQAVEGRPRPLPSLPPPHDDGAAGVAINEAREVTGYGIYVLTGPDFHRAFRFSGESGLSLLTPYPGPARTAGAGINENGDVIGNSGTTSTPDATAWLWTEQGGRVNLIDLLAPEPGLYGVSSGQDINDLGQMVARAITDAPYGAAIVLTPPAAR